MLSAVLLKGMLADIRAAKEGSIVLLHAVAHNPTGTLLRISDGKCTMRLALTIVVVLLLDT